MENQKLSTQEPGKTLHQTRLIKVEYLINYDDSDTLCNQFGRLIEMHLEYNEANKPDIPADGRVKFPGIGSVKWETDEEHAIKELEKLDLME